MIRDLVEEDVAALVGTLNFKQKVDRSLSLIRSAWQEFGDASDGRLAQLVRARGSHPRGHRFESCSAHHILADETSLSLFRHAAASFNTGVSTAPRMYHIANCSLASSI